MAEYIEREALLQRLKFKRDTTVNLDGRKRYGLDSAISQVRKAQKADVAEVRHGEWIKYPHNSGIYCSRCRHKRRYKDANDNYCPNCGADMRGVEDGR